MNTKKNSRKENAIHNGHKTLLTVQFEKKKNQPLFILSLQRNLDDLHTELCRVRIVLFHFKKTTDFFLMLQPIICPFFFFFFFFSFMPFFARFLLFVAIALSVQIPRHSQIKIALTIGIKTKKWLLFSFFFDVVRVYLIKRLLRQIFGFQLVRPSIYIP